jgi:hypothetical protein
MLTIGKHQATIREHRLSEIGGKEVVRIDCVTEAGDETQVLIWFTEKSMGIARHQLRLCGYDIDKRGLEDLHTEPQLLAGHIIPILVEDWKGQLRAQIQTNSEPSKKRMKELTAQLRACKKDNGEPEIPPTPLHPSAVPAGDDDPADQDDNDLPF